MKFIRILHLEDNPRDTQIIQDKLESDGMDCRIFEVDTRERYAVALEEGMFDVILCDYNLPDYDGISALKLARERAPLTPVILISGSLGEEEAVKCLQHGATDYLLKQRLDRLPSAINRALAAAESHRKYKKAQNELHESEERFRQLAEQSHEGFWFVAVSPRRVLYVSPAMEKIWDLPAERFYDDADAALAAIHPADQPHVRDAWEACLQGESPRYEAEYRVIRQDGSVRWVQDSGTPTRNAAGAIVRLGGIAQDITERKAAERHMLRTQRLESIGTLASGVAHDLNNALAPILMGLDYLKWEYPSATHVVELFESSANRGAGMVRQLLTFAKGSEGERVSLQTSGLVKEVRDMMRGTLPKNIMLEGDCDPDLPKVLGDATQLHQILLNLCVNARDAMPTGGTLTLESEVMDVDATYASGVPGAKPGRYVALRVRDTGMGIPPEILDRIFDPFFTTKGSGGTGLGLSTVMGIVKGHGGFLQVDSSPGLGSTFTAHIPVDMQGEELVVQVPETQTTFRGQGETILFVDDEKTVLDVGRVVLTRLNLNVLTAADGTAGLVKLMEHRNELRVVITDMHMPHMDGIAFIRVLREVLPDIPVIVGSGRLDPAQAEELKRLGVVHRLDKPYTQHMLTKMLASLLNEMKTVRPLMGTLAPLKAA
jgi:PAS domain S-box-containing protein